MDKHIVKHIGGALCPSKSGLMNKHIVKHISGALFPSKSGLMNKHIVKHIVRPLVAKTKVSKNISQRPPAVSSHGQVR